MSTKTAKDILPKESGGSLYDKFIKKYPFYNMAYATAPPELNSEVHIRVAPCGLNLILSYCHSELHFEEMLRSTIPAVVNGMVCNRL
jgi:hypothetical protein